MQTLDAILLGIIQGITEFFPVSSSGHLKLFQYFLGLKNLDRYILFDLVCHLGSLIAILILFWDKIVYVIKQDRIKILQAFVALLPLIPIFFGLKTIKNIYNQPQYLGFFFLTTSWILFAGIHWGFTKRPERMAKTRWSDSFMIGVFQALAVLPGISRSGSTISAARLLGWSREEAIFFSFFLSIPTIIGASAYEVYTHCKDGTLLNSGVPFTSYLLGFITSFVAGYFALRYLIQLLKQDKFIYFVWYTLAIGIATVLYFSI